MLICYVCEQHAIFTDLQAVRGQKDGLHRSVDLWVCAELVEVVTRLDEATVSTGASALL
jgi:hypothetical protein